MKLKDIAKLCKARGIITLTQMGGTQWIGDFGATFPALGMLIPTFGWINERYYYGYPVIAIAFAWLCWRCKIEIGVRKRRSESITHSPLPASTK